MKIQEIKKRCSRCDNLYEIPNIKESKARNLMIDYYPCCHCGFIKDVNNPKNNRSGRCLDCAIPFQMIDHQGKGRCNRCYMRMLRNATKTQ